MRSGTARGGCWDRMGLRACAGRRGLGGGEGGAISRQPAPSGGGLARDSLGRFFWRVGEEGWSCERTAERRQGRWVRGRGEGWGGGVASGRGGLETGPYERWGTSGGGAGA